MTSIKNFIFIKLKTFSIKSFKTKIGKALGTIDAREIEAIRVLDQQSYLSLF